MNYYYYFLMDRHREMNSLDTSHCYEVVKLEMDPRQPLSGWPADHGAVLILEHEGGSASGSC